MSERLNDLKRQRALAQEQLDWLDREIARESGAEPQVPAKPGPTAVVAAAPSPAIPPPDLDELIKKFRDDGQSVQSEVKRGCFLYFFAALALLALAIFGLYLLRQ